MPRNTSRNPTALPLYVQLSELIMREIASGQLQDGERLPPERTMAQQLNTSVRTLRKALQIVEDKALIERIQGSGNYVRARPDIDNIYAMFRLELVEGGGLPTAQVITFDVLDKPADLPQFGRAPRATRIRRLRALNAIPIAVEEIWLDASAGLIKPAKLSESLYSTYKTQLGFWISRAEDYVSVAPVPDWAPDTFDPRPGTHVGFVERFSHSDQLGDVEYSRNWFDPARARYVQRLR